MRLPLRQSSDEARPGVIGPVRLDRRTGSLVRRLRPGDIAVVDHLDLDRATAQALVDCRVAAVVNASPFISGRYPNLGPELLASAGVPLVEGVGTGVFSDVKEGSTARLHRGAVIVGDREVASGHELSADEITALMQDARTGLSTQLQSFTHNSTEFLRREQELLLHGRGVPSTATPFEGRPVVVVVRGYDYLEELRLLRRFIREQHPVLIGVDGGAEALARAGHRPDLVVVGEEGLAQGSDTDREPAGAVSDRVLRGSREVVLHADSSGRAVGSDRLDRLGVRYQTMASSALSEDVALLLSDVRGASLIVTVGTHATLDELLDRQRTGLASTFLTRLRVGPKLVDAKSVPQLYAGRVRAWHLALVVLAGLTALVAALAVTPVGGDWVQQAWSSLTGAISDLITWIQGLFS